jgi:hypothetical protein
MLDTKFDDIRITFGSRFTISSCRYCIFNYSPLLPTTIDNQQLGRGPFTHRGVARPLNCKSLPVIAIGAACALALRRRCSAWSRPSYVNELLSDALVRASRREGSRSASVLETTTAASRTLLSLIVFFWLN